MNANAISFYLLAWAFTATRRWLGRIRIHLCSWMLGAILAAGPSLLAVDVQVSTAKPSYYPGERLEVLITVTNSATLSFPTTQQTLYTMDGVYTPSLVGVTIPTQATTPYTWGMSHDWSDYNLLPGPHSVVGTVLRYGTSLPASFEIVDPPPPPGDFLVNCETIPGTTAPVAHLTAYSACGVQFRTSLGAACDLRGGNGNRWVEGFDPYPTGFNVAADFAMPVFGASAKVAGGTDARITMTARNAQGHTLATVVSAPITQPGQFTQTLFIKALEPIASLEWWPSAPHSMVGVDDLLVITSPILHYVHTGAALRLMWPTLEGAGYQLWFSPDLKAWSRLGTTITGTGGVLTNDCSLTGQSLFFRVSKNN